MSIIIETPGEPGKLRKDLPPLPDNMRRLPLDARGYPVPWFVEWVNGVPDFRIIKRAAIGIAHNERRCWICGNKRAHRAAFVIGPMCAVNLVSSEPPSHLDCAEFAARACPFLAIPTAKRREANKPPHREMAGIGIVRNPGVTLLWITESYKPFRTEIGEPGILFRIGPPLRVLWFAEGRAATRDEIMASIDTGYPQLMDMAKREGQEAIDELDAAYHSALELVPA